MTQADWTRFVKGIAFVFLALPMCGCSSYVTRIVSYSLQRMTEPIQPPAHRVLSPILPNTNLAVLWVGHAAMLIQIHDKVFMTDPSFTKTIGLIVRRAVEPGLDPSSLSSVDYTLISHLHFDHFSYGSLDLLPKNGKLLIPSGGAAYTPELGFAETRELKPWEVLEENGVRITAVPVQHFGGRYGFDIQWNAGRGYTGWVVEYKGKTVFVAGDTGYHPEYFKEIGRRFSVDVAIVPIAPVGTRESGSRVHVSPKEAVQILEDVNAKIMIPMHHRTFFQGVETAPTFAQDLLKRILEEKKIHARVKILDIGEQWIE